MRQIVAIFLVPLLLVTQGVLPAFAHEGPCQSDDSGRHHAAHLHVKSIWGNSEKAALLCDCCPDQAADHQSSTESESPNGDHDEDAIYVNSVDATMASRGDGQKVAEAAVLALDSTPMMLIEVSTISHKRSPSRLICEVHSCPTYLRTLALLI